MENFFITIENHFEVAIGIAIFIIWALEIIFKKRE